MTSTRRSFLRTSFVGGSAGMTAWLTACRSHTQAVQAAATESLRDAYSLDPKVTYLNHGSIGTIPTVVQRAHVDYLTRCERNPWFHMWSGEWDDPREHTRARAAELLGCDADEVALNHNTTEGFSLLAAGLPLGPGDEVVFSSLNHQGASVAWHHQAAARGFAVRPFEFPLAETPELTPEQVVAIYERQLTPKTKVLVFPHVDNLVGVRHPLRALCEMARRHGVKFVAVDGAQSLGMFPIDVHDAGIDFFCASPHKWVQSPKGTGLLFARRDAAQELRPHHVTWGQGRWADSARRFEDFGTRDLPATLALGHAIEFQLARGVDRDEAARRSLWQHLRDAVDEDSRLVWQSPRSWDVAASLVAIEPESRSANEVFAKLWPESGFVVRAFQNPLNTLRVSPNVANTTAELTRLVTAIRQLG